jgi:hypothetical protein
VPLESAGDDWPPAFSAWRKAAVPEPDARMRRLARRATEALERLGRSLDAPGPARDGSSKPAR